MKTIEEAVKDSLMSAGLMSDMRLKTIVNAFTTGFYNGYDYANKWYSFNDRRPPYYKPCLVKVHEKTEPIAAWLASTGDSNIWTICSTDIILPPVKLWRPIF